MNFSFQWLTVFIFSFERVNTFTRLDFYYHEYLFVSNNCILSFIMLSRILIFFFALDNLIIFKIYSLFICYLFTSMQCILCIYYFQLSLLLFLWNLSILEKDIYFIEKINYECLKSLHMGDIALCCTAITKFRMFPGFW